MPGYPDGAAINYCPGQARKKSADKHQRRHLQNQDRGSCLRTLSWNNFLQQEGGKKVGWLRKIWRALENIWLRKESLRLALRDSRGGPGRSWEGAQNWSKWGTKTKLRWKRQDVHLGRQGKAERCRHGLGDGTLEVSRGWLEMRRGTETDPPPTTYPAGSLLPPPAFTKSSLSPCTLQALNSIICHNVPGRLVPLSPFHGRKVKHNEVKWTCPRSLRYKIMKIGFHNRWLFFNSKHALLAHFSFLELPSRGTTNWVAEKQQKGSVSQFGRLEVSDHQGWFLPKTVRRIYSKAPSPWLTHGHLLPVSLCTPFPLCLSQRPNLPSLEGHQSSWIRAQP